MDLSWAVVPAKLVSDELLIGPSFLSDHLQLALATLLRRPDLDELGEPGKGSLDPFLGVFGLVQVWANNVDDQHESFLEFESRLSNLGTYSLWKTQNTLP